MVERRECVGFAGVDLPIPLNPKLHDCCQKLNVLRQVEGPCDACRKQAARHKDVEVLVADIFWGIRRDVEGLVSLVERRVIKNLIQGSGQGDVQVSVDSDCKGH